MTRITTTSFWLPKAGNAVQEYEDAFFAGKQAGLTTRHVYAIADGATESLLSGKWANLMVKRFVRLWDSYEEMESWLSKTLRGWQYEKRDYIRQRERRHRPVQRDQEPGLEAGAFAALLGLVVTRSHDGFTWYATAIGDCCMVQVRNGQLLCAFPLAESGAFNSRPFLLSSNPARNAGSAEHFVRADGQAQGGDHFYLMTDALAVWFFRAYEQGRTPWQLLNLFHTATVFAEWVNEKRDSNEMRNDDVTLLHLEFVD